MDDIKDKLAKSILIELETLDASLGFKETILTMNRILNDARKLAEEIEKEAA